MKTLSCRPILGFGAALLIASGCLSQRREIKVNDYLDDKVMAARVLQVLHSQPGYQFPQVQVAVTNGIVHLAGSVNTPEQRLQAPELARSVHGVGGVQNQLRLER